MESTAYYHNKLKILREAIEGFVKVLKVDLSDKTFFEQDVYKNASVQKFEYCIELFWKVAKLYLSIYKGIEESSPKDVIKSFFRQTELSEQQYEALIQMITHRNLLSHLYDSKQFEEILAHFSGHGRVLMEVLEFFPT
ncbi:MAG: HI0074 family nucleotidyltransferase substrate-binding subunit [Waddliaceae bacterium]